MCRPGQGYRTFPALGESGGGGVDDLQCGVLRPGGGLWERWQRKVLGKPAGQEVLGSVLQLSRPPPPWASSHGGNSGLFLGVSRGSPLSCQSQNIIMSFVSRRKTKTCAVALSNNYKSITYHSSGHFLLFKCRT